MKNLYNIEHNICPNCLKICSSKDSLDLHMSKIICIKKNICHKCLHIGKDLINHTCNNKLFKCYLCNNEYSRKNALVKHIKKKHIIKEKLNINETNINQLLEIYYNKFICKNEINEKIYYKLCEIYQKETPKETIKKIPKETVKETIKETIKEIKNEVSNNNIPKEIQNDVLKEILKKDKNNYYKIDLENNKSRIDNFILDDNYGLFFNIKSNINRISLKNVDFNKFIDIYLSGKIVNHITLNINNHPKVSNNIITKINNYINMKTEPKIYTNNEIYKIIIYLIKIYIILKFDENSIEHIKLYVENLLHLKSIEDYKQLFSCPRIFFTMMKPLSEYNIEVSFRKKFDFLDNKIKKRFREHTLSEILDSINISVKDFHNCFYANLYNSLKISDAASVDIFYSTLCQKFNFTENIKKIDFFLLNS